MSDATSVADSVLKTVFTYKNLVHAVAGAVGSSVAITVFYPLDTVRTRLQVDEKRKARFTNEVLSEILDEEGFEGLYRGLQPVVTSICCSNFVYFYVYNMIKTTLNRRGHTPSATRDLLIAFAAGCVNVVTTTPLWVANTRLKLQGAKFRSDHGDEVPKYSGLIDCMYKLYKEHGLGVLWASTFPSIVLASNPAVHFMVYESLKRKLHERLGDREFGGFVYFIIGAIAKLIAAVVTYPVQIVQSRTRSGRQKGQNISIFGMLMDISKRQGIKGLYKGLEAKLWQTVLTAALMFLTYEKIATTVTSLMRLDKGRV